MPNSNGDSKVVQVRAADPVSRMRWLRRSRMRGAVSPVLIGVIVLVLVAGLVGWWLLGRKAGPAATAPVAGTGAATQQAAPSTTDTAAQADLTVDQLYGEARKAMSDNRMVAPAGNNALEYYLRILDKQPDNTNAKDALRELFPFATAGVEDQINQNNIDEATRIMDLLTKADSSNYTLTILRSKMDAKKKQVERDLALKAQQEAAAAAAAARPQTAATPETPAATAPASAASTAGTATPAATPRPTETTPPPATPPPVVAPQGETRDVRVVTAPRPNYPPAAARNGQSGFVEVEFTVAANGEVQNVHVVSSEPARVFDREAVRAIERAKFEPRLENGQPVASTLRRRIEFSLDR